MNKKKLPIPYPSSLSASDFGLSFIHQDVGLSPNLTVLENFCLGHGFITGVGGRILWKKEAERVEKVINGFGHDISPWTRIYNLSAADKTIVAIARALDATEESGKIFVLDEVTAALPQNEVDRLFSIIRNLTDRGIGVLYISHRLHEIFEIADRVTIFRDGNLIATHPISELSERRLVELITGRDIDSYYPPAGNKTSDNRSLLKVDKLYGEKINNVSFEIGKGEIVGLAGLIGSGCSELGRLLFGDIVRSSGDIWYRGKKINFTHPNQAKQAGIGLITEDRRHDGSFPLMTVAQNITITDLNRFWKRGLIKKGNERKEVDHLLSKFRVVPPDPDKTFKHLSGGNQQKVILAKWLRLELDLLICDEPVVGVDIGAKIQIYAVLEEIAKAGTAILMISTEFEDLANLCDRVLVVQNGSIAGELAGDGLSEERIANIAYLSNQ
jgi:ABC-type sugar transport system ATPase subunit